MIQQDFEPPTPVMTRTVNRLRRPLDRILLERQQTRVSRLVADPRTPNTAESESAFESLQQAYTARGGYDYDPLSTWMRAAERTQALLQLPGMEQPGRAVLDAGAGEGMLGVLLASFGHHPTLADMQDWRDERAAGLPFLAVDLDRPNNLPLEQFDLICSFNTFEHVSDPAAALNGLRRALKPGGLIHLDFGPLFASPWGLHAYRTLHMPYPQFLFNNEFLDRKLAQLGIHDLGTQLDALQPMNRWRTYQFQQLWQGDRWELIEEYHHHETDQLDLVERFPAAFAGRGLTVDDLVTANLRVTLRRPQDDR